jgi:putative sigma-54 modulation protein
MSIDVTARHMHATDDLTGLARSKAEALIADFPRIEHVHVVLEIEKTNHIAEFIVQAGRGGRIEAREVTDNLRVSIDRAAEKVGKQLRRGRQKVKDHHPAMKQTETEKMRGVVQ